MAGIQDFIFELFKVMHQDLNVGHRSASGINEFMDDRFNVALTVLVERVEVVIRVVQEAGR